MKPSRFDILIAELWLGEKCEHAALAAVLGVSMREAQRIMPPANDNRVTQSMWKAALDHAGRKWRDIGTEKPEPGRYGLVCLCFGDETSHAVAVRNDGEKLMAFDNHLARWIRLDLWESIVLPIHKLMTWSKKCWIHNVIEVEGKSE